MPSPMPLEAPVTMAIRSLLVFRLMEFVSGELVSIVARLMRGPVPSHSTAHFLDSASYSRAAECRQLTIQRRRLGIAQRSEARSHVLRQEFWLLPGREVPAFVVLVVVDKPGIRLLRPSPRGWIQLVRKHAHGNGDGNALDTEKVKLVLPVETLPIETGRGNRG